MHARWGRHRLQAAGGNEAVSQRNASEAASKSVASLPTPPCKKKITTLIFSSCLCFSLTSFFLCIFSFYLLRSLECCLTFQHPWCYSNSSGKFLSIFDIWMLDISCYSTQTLSTLLISIWDGWFDGFTPLVIGHACVTISLLCDFSSHWENAGCVYESWLLIIPPRTLFSLRRHGEKEGQGKWCRETKTWTKASCKAPCLPLRATNTL